MRQIRKYQKDKGRILDSNKLLYHSLPIGCILALLLLGCSLLNPAGFGNGISNGMNDSLSSMGSNKAYADSNEEEGISTLANGDNISLSISGDVNAAVTAGTDKPVFRSHTVTASASNIESYSLTIKYDTGSTSLKNSTAGATVINDLSTNTVGSNIPDNTWGWGWSDSTTTADTAMTYQAMSTSDKVIKSSTNPTNNAANISGKLAFGAKFAEGATAGHYQANILVSFAIKPQEVTTAIWSNGVDSGISTMQEMTPAICKNNSNIPTNATITLRDSRDGKSYTVAKLKDGNCWMTQNLALSGENTLTINNSDLSTAIFTDINKTYVLPAASDAEGFNNVKIKDKDGTEIYANQQVRNPADPDNNKYGAYYSWCAATAGTCQIGMYADIIPNSSNPGNAGNVANSTAVPKNQNATSSICPKGWQLPVNGDISTDKSYAKLVNGISVGSALTSTPYNFVYGGSFFSSLNAGSYGSYWSSTAYHALVTYYMRFSSDAVSPSFSEGLYSGIRSSGFSVRCVAR